MRSQTIEMDGGWKVSLVVDDDNHLNVYVGNKDGTSVEETDLGIAGEDGEALAWRFTTTGIEKAYQESEGGC